MAIELKEYCSVEKHKEIFDHNFAAVDQIGEYPGISGFIMKLSSLSGLEKDLILISIKRFLMSSQEYNPTVLKNGIETMLLPFKFILSLLKKIIFKNDMPRIQETDVIVDDWYGGSSDTFYGKELMEGLKKNHVCILSKYSNIHYIKLRHLFAYLPKYMRTFLRSLKLSRESGVNFSNYHYEFFIEFLKGLSVREALAPKVILSGNDNGFQKVQGKASGAELILIQNGNRAFWGDSTFLFADHYISLFGRKFDAFSKQIGCHFKKMSFFGSLRVYNHSRVIQENIKRFDILYVSGWEPDYPEIAQNGGLFASATEELRSIELFTEYARHSDLKIAYRCRSFGETERLKEKGLYLESVQYFKFGEGTIYDLLRGSDLVLSGASTAVWEAFGMGKKAGFIYMSKNPYVNLYAGGLGITYDRESKMPVAVFIDRLRKEIKDFSNYIFQNPNYVTDLLEIVKTGAL